MAYDHSNRPTLLGKVILGGLAAVIGWQSLGPKGKQRVFDILDALSQPMPSDDGRRSLVHGQGGSQSPTKPLTPSTPASVDTAWPPFDIEFLLPKFEIDRAYGESKKGLLSVPVSEPDAKWREIILPPAVVLILGKRGSGKSALAYRLLELFRYRLTPHVVGVGPQARKYLPDWIGIAPDLESLPFNTIALVDEAYLPYHSRRSMAEENMAMSQVLNLSRQRSQALIFVTQEARQVDRNIASSATVIVFKEMGMLQPEFDRPELRKLVGQAKEALESVGGDKRRWSYVYSPDADHIGPLENELASFWKPSLSRIFASGSQSAVQRTAKRLSPSQKAEKARELRSQGRSLSEIANFLGVSKSTVVNYLKGYPYR